MRCAAVLLLGALWTLPVLAQHPAAPAANVPPDAYVISGDEVRHWGLVRLGDIMQLAPVFSGYTADGFRTSGLLFGAGAEGSPPWRVAVDGVEVDATFLDGVHSEALPVSTSRIDEIILLPPGPGPGGLSAAGWVMIRTLPPGRGVGGTFVASAGNEVGDPGPYRYLEEAAPNVDRDGPSADFQVTVPLRWATPGLTMHVGARADQAHLTESSILERVYVLYDGVRKPRMTLLQPRLGLDWRQGEDTHRLRWSQTTLRDLPFFEAMGSELPISRHLGALRMSGSRTKGAFRTSYAVSVERAEMLERSNRFGLNLDWAETRYRTRVAVSPVSQEWALSASVVGRRPDVAGFTPHLTPVPIVEAEIHRTLDSGIRQSWSGRLTLGRVPHLRLLPGLYVHLWSDARPWQWSVRAGFVAETPEVAAPEALWLAGGWDYPGEGAERSTATGARDVRTASLDATVARQFERGHVQVSLFGRAYHGLNKAATVLEPDSLFLDRYLADRDFRGEVRGRTLGVRVSGTQDLGPWMNHRLDYTVTGRPAASE
ncbi:MAG: hypothetical protein HKN29_06390, partial [Rhodothermales bacterium]|nr:hypothetical protein [Rhodothermales bacterium]